MKAVTAALALTLMGGCADVGSGPDAVEPPVTPPSHPSENATRLDWNWDAAFALVVGTGCVPMFQCHEDGTVDVPANASWLNVTSTWSCASGPACRLGFEAEPPGAPPHQAPVYGASPLSIRIEKPPAGAWRLNMVRDSASVVLRADGHFDVVLVS